MCLMWLCYTHNTLVFVSCSPDLLCQERPSTAPAGSVQLFLDETRSRALHTRSSQNNISSMKGAGAMVTAEVRVSGNNRATTVLCYQKGGSTKLHTCNLIPTLCAASIARSLTCCFPWSAFVRRRHTTSRGAGVVWPTPAVV
jgi:hypothetical protein